MSFGPNRLIFRYEVEPNFNELDLKYVGPNLMSYA